MDEDTTGEVTADFPSLDRQDEHELLPAAGGAPA